MDSKIMREDVERILADNLIPWSALRGATVLVTGGTGTIGAAIARTLSAAGKRFGLESRIVIHGRNKVKAAPLAELPGVEFLPGDIREPLTIDGNVDHIFHCAALAKSPDMASNPVGVAETSLKGAWNALSLAREKRPKSVVFLSSMEVYGATDPALPVVTEKDMGTIDVEDPRSCYPESKRMGECLGACFHAQYGVPVKMARLAQTFGAGSSVEDTLVAIQFARNAMAGEDIILHTEGRSRGNFCYISDAVRALLFVLLKGKNGEAYNIANPAACVTIREMAEIVAADVCGGEVSVVVNPPSDILKRGYARDVTRRLGTEKLERLGWVPTHGLAEMYRRTIGHWRECTAGFCG